MTNAELITAIKEAIKEEIPAIAEAVALRIKQSDNIRLDAAFLASLSTEEYNAIMKPRFRASKSTPLAVDRKAAKKAAK